MQLNRTIGNSIPAIYAGCLVPYETYTPVRMAIATDIWEMTYSRPWGSRATFLSLAWVNQIKTATRWWMRDDGIKESIVASALGSLCQ